MPGWSTEYRTTTSQLSKPVAVLLPLLWCDTDPPFRLAPEFKIKHDPQRFPGTEVRHTSVPISRSLRGFITILRQIYVPVVRGAVLSDWRSCHFLRLHSPTGSADHFDATRSGHVLTTLSACVTALHDRKSETWRWDSRYSASGKDLGTAMCLSMDS